MCGRFTQERSSTELAELYDAESLVEDAGGHYNVAPTQDALVVVEREGERRLNAYRWGLVPPWATSARAAARAFNARSETIASSPVFRVALRRRRCIVPADAFYEWRRDGAGRQPFAIRRRDGLPLALAGLWSPWRDPDTGDLRRTFTIVTTRPNALIAELHDRMPVILDAAAWAPWLHTGRVGLGELMGLLEPSAADMLEAFPVSRLVNDVRNDGPELMRRLSGDPPPAPEGLGLA